MIDLTVTIDNDEAKKRFEELRRTAKQTTSSIVTDAERMDAAMRFRPQIDKKAAKEAEKTMQAIVEAMPLNIGAAFQKTERQIKSFVAKLQKEVQQAQIYSWMSETPSSNPLSGIEETLTHLPEKANAAAGGFNNLNFATQQLVREVPAATMGLHMFFLAISNNLPFFADAIKQVREENKALAASGKPTVGVFKQIIGSIFSWQTALIAGITALTLYGKEIGNWVKGLFKGKEALDAVARAEKTLADVRRQGMLDAQEEVTQVKLAVKAMQDSNRSLEERKRAMRTLQDQYPEYFGKLREEQMLYGDVGDSVDVLIKKMVALATARKSFDKLVENEQNMSLLEGAEGYASFKAANEAYNATGRKKTKRVESIGLGGGVYTAQTAEYLKFSAAQDKVLENLEEGTKEQQALFKIISEQYDGNINAYIKAIKESNKKLTEEASALITTPDLSEDKAAAEEQKRKAEAVLAEVERQAEERKRAIQRLNNDLSKEVQRTQREMDDAEIASIKDGIERKRREIQAGYERRAAEIDKYEADIKAAQGGELTPEQKGHISYLRQANTDTLMAGKVLIKAMQDEAAQEATNAMNEYLASYGTFQEKIVAITAKYSRLIADAQTEGERKTLEAERDALLTEYEVQASDWAKSLVDKSTEQLQTMTSNLQSVVDSLEAEYNALDSSDTDEAKQLRETINMLKAQIKVLQSRLGEADNAAKGGNWGAASEVFQGIATACNEAADALEGVDSSLADTFRNMGQVASAAGSLVSAISAVATASTALQTALGIIGVIAAAIQAVGVIISMFGDEYTLQDTINEAKELNKELERMRKLAQIDSVDGGLFGENAWGNFRNNLKVMGDALKSFHDTQDAIINRGKEVWGDVAESHGVFTEEMKEAGAGWDDARVTLEHSWASLEDSIRNIQIKTRDRSKAAEFFGARDEYANLGDLAPEIFEGGKVTLEGLQELKNSELWDKISKENKDLIDELIANWELYNDSLEATNEYLGSIFGELGNAIKDALVDAFESGTDAAEAMGDAIGNVIKQITSDIAYSAFIMPLIEDANNAIKALTLLKEQHGISDEEYAEKLITIGYNLVDGALAQQDAVNAFLGGAYDAAIERGYDPNSMGQSTTSKGFQAMSQDTGDELNGRFTDIQGKVSGIHEAVQFMKGLSSEQLNRVASIDTTVAMIHNDTTLIEKHTRVLGAMYETLERIRTNTELL